MGSNLEVEVSDLMEEHRDDLVVEGLCFAAYLVVVHLEVVSGRANRQLLEDVQEVDLYFIGNQVEDRLILVGLLVLEEVVRADLLLVAIQPIAFSQLMPHLLAMLPALRHRQYWMKCYICMKMRIIK